MSQPAAAPGALSSAELKLAAGFMESAAEDFGEHSSNDFFLPATAENKAVFVAILEHRRSAEPDHGLSAEAINAETDEVFIYDHWAMAYFAERCGKLATGAGAAPLSPAELFALGDLLALAYEDHESSSDDVDHDIVLRAGGEHRPILAETIKLYRAEHERFPDAYRQEVAARLKSIVPVFLGGGEIRIPDFWIMCQLAHKCRALSGSKEPLYTFDDEAKDEDDANETEWAKGYTPTPADLRADELRKEVRDLARRRFKTARAYNTMAADRYLSVLIIADTEAERDALHADKAFVSALELVRKKATLQGLDMVCFAFLSQEAVERDYAGTWASWWFEGTCPQIRYDAGLSAREKALRLGFAPEILDLAAKAENAVPAEAEEEAQVEERKGAAAFLRKHWLVVAFFAFFLAVLLFGKR